jgi:predicted transcriptional regulator
MVPVSLIMTRSVLSLRPSMTIRQALVELSDFKITGAPVCDEQGEVVGIFSKSDAVDSLADGHSLEDNTVANLMNPAVLFVHESDPVETVIQTLYQESIHRLVVLDHNESLVGIVTPMDIIKALAQNSWQPGSSSSLFGLVKKNLFPIAGQTKQSSLWLNR